MPESCTCGARPPEDARFCHKCGRPMREDTPEETVAVELSSPEPLSPPLLPMTELPPIGFSNGVAVRVALGSGFLAFVVTMVLGMILPQAFSMIWVAAAGFWSVFVYRRRTGQQLSILEGAHLGWICGVFLFVIATLLVTAMAVALSDPTVVAGVRAQMAGRENEVNQMIETLRSATGIAGALAGTFLIFTILPALGGALGAKFLVTRQPESERKG